MRLPIVFDLYSKTLEVYIYVNYWEIVGKYHENSQESQLLENGCKLLENSYKLLEKAWKIIWGYWKIHVNCWIMLYNKCEG